MFISCGPLSHKVSFRRSSAVSGRTTACWIASFILKHTSEMPLLTKNMMPWLFSLTWKRAYDMTWKQGILADLCQDLGFRGHLPVFSERFRSEHSFEVRAAQAGDGVLQGSILSSALFSIMINIINAVLKGTDCSMFVDSFYCVYMGQVFKILKQPLRKGCAAVHQQHSRLGAWEWF